MKNYSVAIYGSSLRSDFDKYSDKDLLIVSSSYKRLNQLKKSYEERGFSVSTYTYSKLQFLSRKGSLFIEHLRKESSILIDDKNRLKCILESHIETVPTTEQLKEAHDYFTFLKDVPNSETGYAWFCDCFYVGLRNYLILESAKRKVYNFSFLNLIEDLKDTNLISENEYIVLRELRILKKNYRDKILDEQPDKEYVTKITKLGQRLNLLSEVNFVSFEFFATTASKIFSNINANHYHKLRLIEIYYLSLNISIQKIDRIISSPQFYAFRFKDQAFLNDLLKDINEKTAHNKRFCAIEA